MGIKQCNRAGCDNALCDRYSVDLGYICPECFMELVRLGVDADIEAFMASDKGPAERRNQALALGRFEKVFPDYSTDRHGSGAD